MPRRLAVRAMRHAISPRLAMRILSNIWCRSWLRLGPTRGTLVEEGSDAFLPLGAHADLGDARRGLFGQQLIYRPVRNVRNEVLGGSDCLRATLKQLVED